MHYNNAARISREVIIRIARGFSQKDLFRMIDRIPVDMVPKDEANIRCCIYKDRALIKYRCMAALGIPAEDETDEITPLSEYAQRTLSAPDPEMPLLTILHAACTSCRKSHFHITNACKGCAARPCTTVCPKGAVKVVHGQAVIDSDSCVNCGKCRQICPYHAIVRIPVPCEESCPVQAIRDNEAGQKVIDRQRCISCGRCIGSCPFGAVMECSQMLPILRRLHGRGHVTALAAPALYGQFGASWAQLEQALLSIGFNEVIQVAQGAEEAIVHETDELYSRLSRKESFMTSSCCPSYIEAVNKHIPELKPFVSETPSPMIYSARRAKHQHPDTTVVFIGPCLAKRTEAARSEVVDFVMTFEELGALFVAAEVFPPELEGSRDPRRNPSVDAQGFAVSGGVAGAIARAWNHHDIPLKPAVIQHLDKKQITLLRQAVRGRYPGNFLEVMACEHGCAGGPCSLEKPETAEKKITQRLSSTKQTLHRDARQELSPV